MLGMLHAAELDLRKSKYTPDLLVNQTKGKVKAMARSKAKPKTTKKPNKAPKATKGVAMSGICLHCRNNNFQNSSMWWS
ncbi:hypothetical protein SLEP1_g35884 [Rubroshorea leprosula]|uniref:Uncharacterized protein n=1 Tax=Rubroshorea leprosula TaxID=152421 RepID=A0AAV5KPT9_9ROSI|nr:hypothetical protein SLEP1_g35884 [Rubroshorea leprosula]